MGPNTIHINDCLTVMKTWPDSCVDCAITSIPYWGLRSYSWGGDKGCKHKWTDLDDTLQGCACGARRPRYGIEPTLDEFLAKTVEIFREVRRVLKPWGTLFLNIGDKMDDGDCLLLPARVALALQADGWVLRSEIIWVKAWSFHECNGRRVVENGTDLFGESYEDVIVDEKDYVGSCMPESVNGWRWTRHKVKIKNQCGSQNNRYSGWTKDTHPETRIQAEWQDCPACDKCEPNGGLVLRKGNWRPTKAHEQLFQFSKPGGYYCDAEAVKEKNSENAHDKGTKLSPPKEGIVGHKDFCSYTPAANMPAGRNLRDCWCISTQAFTMNVETVRWQRVEQDAVCDGTMHIVFANCPTCAGLFVQVAKQLYGEHANDLLSRILRIYDHPVLSQVPDFSKTGRRHDDSIWLETLGSFVQQCFFSATNHNIENHKMALFLSTNSPYIFSGETIDRIDDKLERLLFFVLQTHIHGNSILPDEMDAHLLGQMPYDTVRKSSLPIPFNKCICAYYKKITQKSSHFATFPEKLVEPCIKAGTSEKGNCPKCGMPYVRVIDSRQIKRDRPADRTARHNEGQGVNSCGNTVAGVSNTTIGWRASCNCNAGDSPGDKPVPAVVLDPFMGSGTVGLVAERLGRNWLGIEINPEYVTIAEKRLSQEGML